MILARNQYIACFSCLNANSCWCTT